MTAVGEGNVAAGAVDRELAGEILEQSAVVGGEQVLEFADVLELAAIGQVTARIHGRTEPEADADERIDGAARGPVAGADRAVACAEAADHVECFQREPRRI